MNARELSDGGLASTNTFWEVSIPVTVASMIIPIAFSSLLIRMATKGLRKLDGLWLLGWPSFVAAFLVALNIASAVVDGDTLFWVLWTANLLYTLEFLREIRANLRHIKSSFKEFRDAADARAAKNATRTKIPNPSEQADQSADSQTRESRNTAYSGQSVDSWVTVQSSYSEDSWETVHSSVTSSNNNLSHSINSSIDEHEREIRELRRDIVKIGMQVLAECSHVAAMAGGFILGTMFLVLDILYHPKSRATLSVYHSFALWMSLIGVLHKVAAVDVLQCVGRLAALTQRYEWPKTWWKPPSRTQKRPPMEEREDKTEGGGAGMV